MFCRNPFFKRLFSDIERLQLFTLCEKFKNLTLDDKKGKSSSSTSSSSTSEVNPSYSYSETYQEYLSNSTLSSWNRSIIEKFRAPFLEVPRDLIKLFPIQSSSDLKLSDLRMGIGFRFLPGQSQFLTQELHLPESFDRLSFISNTLGLSYNSRPLSAYSSYPYSRAGAGLHGLVHKTFNKILVEVITFYNGRYGRFLVLVGLGYGCTVWYGFLPGVEHLAPVGNLFHVIDSYNPFMNYDYYSPYFSRASFLEKTSVSLVCFDR